MKHETYVSKWGSFFGETLHNNMDIFICFKLYINESIWLQYFKNPILIRKQTSYIRTENKRTNWLDTC